MSNNRVYWAVKAIGIAPLGSNTFVTAHGAQDIGMNVNFNLESVFEIGQSSAYQRVEYCSKPFC